MSSIPQQQQRQQVQQPMLPPPAVRSVAVAAEGPGSSAAASASSSNSAGTSKTTNVFLSPAMPTKSIKKWFRKQRRKHMASMTEEQKSRMLRNLQRQNREQVKHRMCRKAKKMAYASAFSRTNMAKSLMSYSATNGKSAAVRAADRSMAMNCMASVAVVQNSRLESSESEDDIDALEEQAAVAQTEVSDAKAVSLLEQLRKEPTNDKETASKFEIYEQYLAIVEKSREECVKFHKLCSTELQEHVAVVQRMAKAMQSIDSDANRSINWDNLGGRWFVYDMTRQSDRNNSFIGKVFTGLKRDLEMIQDNDMDCPICLENLTTVPTGVRVLHCCHKLCGECYDNWKLACAGNRVICPLCRQEDFQAAVVTRAPSMVQHYLHEMHSDSEDSDSEGAGEPQTAAATAAATASTGGAGSNPLGASGSSDIFGTSVCPPTSSSSSASSSFSSSLSSSSSSTSTGSSTATASSTSGSLFGRLFGR